MIYLIYFFQSLTLIILSPLLVGLLRKFKALLRGYKGAPILQMYFDIIKLCGKNTLRSTTSSIITTVGPTFSFAAAFIALFLIPVFYTEGNNYFGSIFIFVFLLGIVKFFSSLIGLDCASTFGGMGSSRELFISMLAEPLMFISILFLFLETKSFNVFDISLKNANATSYSAAHFVAAASFFILVLAENTRMPVDNPETHLELTMIHEAMILDLSGADLALIELASSFKLIGFLTIFINCFMSSVLYTSSFGLAILFYFVKLIICLLVIAVLEVSITKFRLFRVPELLASAFSLGVVAVTMNYFL